MTDITRDEFEMWKRDRVTQRLLEDVEADRMNALLTLGNGSTLCGGVETNEKTGYFAGVVKGLSSLLEWKPFSEEEESGTA